MSRRSEKRKFLALPVRALAGESGSRHVVCTLDLSAHGARVIGLPKIDVGQEITLEHKNNRVRFQAVWVGKPGSSRHGQVGLRSLDPEKKLAEIDEHVGGDWVDRWSPDERPDQSQADRRSAQRFDCDRGVHYWTEEGGGLTAGQLENISPNGCSIITKFPLPRRTRLGMIVSVYGMKIAAKGEVRASGDGRMGVMFTMVDKENEARLKKVVQRLRQGTSSVERDPTGNPDLQDSEKIMDEVRMWFDRNLTMSWEDFFDIQVRIKGTLVKATESFEKFTS
jgi:hypothetical protein